MSPVDTLDGQGTAPQALARYHQVRSWSPRRSLKNGGEKIPRRRRKTQWNLSWRWAEAVINATLLKPGTTPESSKATSRHPLSSLVRQSCPNPTTSMQHGNSDPFSASSVQITPFSHYLITTWQTIADRPHPSELSKFPMTSSESADLPH